MKNLNEEVNRFRQLLNAQHGVIYPYGALNEQGQPAPPPTPAPATPVPTPAPAQSPSTTAATPGANDHHLAHAAAHLHTLLLTLHTLLLAPA